MAKTKSQSGVTLALDDVKRKLEKHPQWASSSVEEQEYMKAMFDRLIKGRDQMMQPHIELDDMTVAQYVERNNKRANTYIKPRKNKSDINVVSGVSREKLFSVAGHIHRLNLKPEVHSFDKNRDEDVKLGRSFANAINKSRKLENDKEKSLMRMLTLMTEGSCAVEEAWVPTKKTRKKILDYTKLDPATGFDGLEYLEKTEYLYKAESAVISIKNLILGNIRQADFNKQPWVATVEYREYDEVKTIFEGWKNWEFVKPGSEHRSDLQMDNVKMYSDMMLYNQQDSRVEIIKYQDPWNDEYQIIVNGVFMLPMGFPTPWEWDGFSISFQVFEPITPYFALGKSLMAKVDRDDELLTIMLRLFVHKTLQSVKPPVANLSSRKLPPDLFDPGKIWNGVNPAQIKPLIEHNGVNGNEWQMFEKVREFIDSKSISRIAQGQQLSQGATATESLILEKQAKMAIGLMLFAYTMLEQKMAEKRLSNILSNWTTEEEESWDEIKKETKKRIKPVHVSDANFGDKRGTEKIVFTQEEFTFKEKYQRGLQMFKEEERSNKGERTTYISLPILRRLKYTHHIQITPSEEENDNLNKILLQEELTQAMNFFGPGNINLDFYKRKFASVWGNDPVEMFNGFGIDQLQALALQGADAQSSSPLPGTQGGPQSGSAMANSSPSAAQASGKEGVDRQLDRNQQKAQGALMNR